MKAKKINWTSIIFLINFLIYGYIAAYDYTIGSKWMVCWGLLSLLMLAFFIIEEIKFAMKKQAQPEPEENKKPNILGGGESIKYPSSIILELKKREEEID